MWYNEGTKIVVLGGACNTPSRINLDWRFIMDTVPHHVPQSNPHQKLVFHGGLGRRTGLRYHRGTGKMVVYGMADPRDGRIRYIGITNNLLARFNEHLRLNGPNERKQAWLRELLDAYMLPYMVTLEVVDVTVSAREREVAYIQAYTDAGFELLNDEVINP